jgi:hypothetical protein
MSASMMFEAEMLNGLVFSRFGKQFTSRESRRCLALLDGCEREKQRTAQWRSSSVSWHELSPSALATFFHLPGCPFVAAASLLASAGRWAKHSSLLRGFPTQNHIQLEALGTYNKY